MRKYALPRTGFTLLEALAALSIAALAVEIVLNASTLGLTAARRERATLEAVARAQSHLAELSDPAGLRPGSYTGDDGGGYTYILNVDPVDVARPLRPLRLSGGVQALPAALFRIEATVKWPDGRQNRAVTLSSYAIAPVRSLGGRPPGSSPENP